MQNLASFIVEKTAYTSGDKAMAGLSLLAAFFAAMGLLTMLRLVVIHTPRNAVKRGEMWTATVIVAALAAALFFYLPFPTDAVTVFTDKTKTGERITCSDTSVEAKEVDIPNEVCDEYNAHHGVPGWKLPGWKIVNPDVNPLQ